MGPDRTRRNRSRTLRHARDFSLRSNSSKSLETEDRRDRPRNFRSGPVRVPTSARCGAWQGGLPRGPGVTGPPRASGPKGASTAGRTRGGARPSESPDHRDPSGSGTRLYVKPVAVRRPFTQISRPRFARWATGAHKDALSSRTREAPEAHGDRQAPDKGRHGWRGANACRGPPPHGRLSTGRRASSDHFQLGVKVSYTQRAIPR